MKRQLWPYQDVAVDHLSRNPQAGLFLDMGLGKTASALSALTDSHLPVLVTAPKRVAEMVWQEERDKWRPDLSLQVAAGSRAQRAEAIRSGADIVVIGRDNLRDLPGMRVPPWKTLVLDELSGFKSRASVRWKTAKKVIAENRIPHVWGLTGTPAPNGLLDLWSQIYLLDGGKRLGTSITGFRSRYFIPTKQVRNIVVEWTLRPGAEQRIYELIEDICLSMAADGRIELPPVTYNTISVEMPLTVRKAYRDMKNTLVADLGLLGEIHSAANAAVMTDKLSQITAGFMYVDDADIRGRKYDILHKEKIHAVCEVVEGTGSPVLVFYRYQAEKAMLTEAMPDLIRSIDEPGVIARWNTGRVPVLLAHPQSAGHGLNLQHGGHTIVWSTAPWSLEEWEQGNARLARQGQEHPVVIHTVNVPRTIDGAIMTRLKLKTSVQDALNSHLESPL